MKSIKYLFSLYFFVSGYLFCQFQMCGTTNPTTLTTVEQSYRMTTSVKVPVIFHVIKGTDNSGDVTDNQLTQQINVLNGNFSGSDELLYTFFLAGINRVKNDNWRNLSRGTQAETNMVNTLAIDPKHALNIYITSTYPSNTLGWLIDWMWMLSEDSPRNGIVIKTDCLPGGSYTDHNLGITCVHEVGHYMGLYHTFDEWMKCKFDDLVSDTPIHNLNTGCPSENTDTCPNNEGFDPIHNHMNYTNDPCRTQFTTGQYSRMSSMMAQYRPNLGGNNLIINTDITINNGDEFIFKDITLKLSIDKKIIVNGALKVQGTSSKKVSFTKNSTHNWGGIQFNSGSSGTIDYCDVTYATTGINAYNSSPTIKHSNIDYSNGVGVYCDYYSSPVMVGNNIRYNSSYGLRCNSFSSPNLTDYGYPGSNVIRNNLEGIFTAYNCSPNLNGYMTYGNSVFDNTSYEVVAFYGSTVNANAVYWGITFPPPDAEFYASSSTINRNNPLQTNPNPNRSIILSGNNHKTPMFSIMSSQADELILAEEKQKEGRYDEAINLFLEVFKKEKENPKGRYALIKIEECFTQAGKKDFLDFSKKELKPLIKEETELYVVLFELETHQLYNMGYKDNAMNNLKTILKKYNYNTEIEKQTLYRMGAFCLDLYNDTLSAEKTFDELAEKYPDDELLTYANMLLNEERYNKPNAKKIEQVTGAAKAEEELLSNNPNPFNPTTIINYHVPENSLVTIKVYDVLGKEVAELVNEEKISGKYSVTFNASNLSSGVYFYTINTGKYSAVKKMLLIK